MITSIFKSLYFLKWCPFLTAHHYTNSQNSTIFFGYVDFQAKIFPILYPPLEISTTRIAIDWLLTPFHMAVFSHCNMYIKKMSKDYFLGLNTPYCHNNHHSWHFDSFHISHTVFSKRKISKSVTKLCVSYLWFLT